VLARTAERVYWMARYLERAEDLARLVSVNSNLLLDLPRRFAPGWAPLVTIIGANELYRAQYGDRVDEEAVLRFLVTDADNGQSITAAASQARENARTFRELLPREGWEEINGLHHFVREHGAAALGKRDRYPFLRDVVRRCQAMAGILAGTMSQDEPYRFVELGRYLERADMTTRIIDVRSTTLISHRDAAAAPYDGVQWMSVLRSLNGLQMYRIEQGARPVGEAVVAFLLRSRRFPRALAFCADEMERCFDALGDGAAPLAATRGLRDRLVAFAPERLTSEALAATMDDLQRELGDVHAAIAATWFLPAVD
jgi:uncharacterized alpha-E superfamily protein